MALQAELAALRDDLAPSMMRQPLSLEDTAAVYVRPRLRQEFIELCTCAITSFYQMSHLGACSDCVLFKGVGMPFGMSEACMPCYDSVMR